METNIILIGMPASGKTTIGQLLSEKLDSYTFIDTDSFIEKTQGLSVVEIFKKYLEQNGYNYRMIRILETSLFLSMLPLHMDKPKKVFGFLQNAMNIMESL